MPSGVEGRRHRVAGERVQTAQQPAQRRCGPRVHRVAVEVDDDLGLQVARAQRQDPRSHAVVGSARGRLALQRPCFLHERLDHGGQPVTDAAMQVGLEPGPGLGRCGVVEVAPAPAPPAASARSPSGAWRLRRQRQSRCTTPGWIDSVGSPMCPRTSAALSAKANAKVSVTPGAGSFAAAVNAAAAAGSWCATERAIASARASAIRALAPSGRVMSRRASMRCSGRRQRLPHRAADAFADRC